MGFLKKLFFLILITLLYSTENKYKQPSLVNKEKLQELVKKFKDKYIKQKKEAINFANSHNIFLKKELSNGTIVELQKIENGIPIYYKTNQRNKEL